METLFTDDLSQAVVESGGGALVYVALRRFRKMRVSLGYAEVARVVAAVRSRLWETVRPSDLLQDLGDGRFVLVVPGVHALEALGSYLEELQGCATEPLVTEARTVQPELRVGVTFFPTNGVDLLDLLRQAELASLSTDGAIAQFVPDQSSTVRDELSLAGDLRAALDAEALTVVFQPFVDARSHALRGAEALVRWTHPVHGPISPARFVPIAEESGLVVRLTDFVLHTAARRVAEALGHLPPDFYVSVNLSGQEILEEGRAERVLEMIQAVGLPAHRLQVEITEGVLMRERRRAVQMLGRLRSAGVLVATDDFGTGYSSLAYLAELPVQTLKIDRLFVRDLPDPNAVKLLRSISALGHSLGLAVLVEGVEDVLQLEACLDCGVDVIQGYHFGRPQPFEELLAWTDPAVCAAGAPPGAPVKDLPVLPPTATTLWSRGGSLEAAELVGLASVDAGLAGELLRIGVDRGVLGVGPTPGVPELVERIGVRAAVAALSERRQAAVVLPPHIVVAGTWGHARVVARFAAELGARLDAGPGLDTLGLLHDIGRLVLLDDPRAGVEHIEAQGWNTPAELAELEAAILHCHHSQVGGLFARRWRWPPELVAVIEHHHREDNLDELPASLRLRVQVVRAADRMAALMMHPTPEAADPSRRSAAILGCLLDDPVRALGGGALSSCWDAVQAQEAP